MALSTAAGIAAIPELNKDNWKYFKFTSKSKSRGVRNNAVNQTDLEQTFQMALSTDADIAAVPELNKNNWKYFKFTSNATRIPRSSVVSASYPTPRTDGNVRQVFNDDVSHDWHSSSHCFLRDVPTSMTDHYPFDGKNTFSSVPMQNPVWTPGYPDEGSPLRPPPPPYLGPRHPNFIPSCHDNPLFASHGSPSPDSPSIPRNSPSMPASSVPVPTKLPPPYQYSITSSFPANTPLPSTTTQLTQDLPDDALTNIQPLVYSYEVYSSEQQDIGFPTNQFTTSSAHQPLFFPDLPMDLPTNQPIVPLTQDHMTSSSYQTKSSTGCTSSPNDTMHFPEEVPVTSLTHQPTSLHNSDVTYLSTPMASCVHETPPCHPHESKGLSSLPLTIPPSHQTMGFTDTQSFAPTAYQTMTSSTDPHPFRKCEQATQAMPHLQIPSDPLEVNDFEQSEFLQILQELLCHNYPS
ncbi:uncharacterized protein LOC143033872 [Oratosquilla oratoria]|uniref:uncharacterized protein LOC143033872 n=1 Tax=Oratosquilla oratoria TaxID=337810 RepID=UPI003F7718C8